MAAIFGVIIGVPALRLRGDYLAIITLGFGEIIRVLVLAVDFTGGAAGLTGIPYIEGKYTLIIYTFFIAFLTVVAILAFIRVPPRARGDCHPRGWRSQRRPPASTPPIINFLAVCGGGVFRGRCGRHVVVLFVLSLCSVAAETFDSKSFTGWRWRCRRAGSVQPLRRVCLQPRVAL